jgi:hypothetical protein
MNTNERPETAKTMKGKSIMRNLRSYCKMAMARAVEKPRLRRILCSLFLVTAVVAAVGTVSSLRANQGGSPRRGELMANPAPVIGNYPLFTYAIDDGTAEASVGRIVIGELLCLNSFPVTAGNNLITSISIAWGRTNPPDPSLNGLPYTAVLWSDPNGDGSPTDAVVLATAPGVISDAGTNTFITSVIPPTLVTTPNFFVGFLMHQPNASQRPAAFDQTPPTLPNRSWFSLSGNINALCDAFPIEQINIVGNFLIRAEGEVGPTPTPAGTPSPTPTCLCQYETTTGTGTIVAGTTDTGNHCDDCTTTISAPFPVSLYGTSSTSIVVSSNGNLQFGGNSPENRTFCPLPICLLDGAILAYYGDLRTDQVADCVTFASGCGVFTSVTGTAPNRQFNIEWRAAYFGQSGTANFEVRFYENAPSLFDIFYGATADNGSGEMSGVQSSSSGVCATTFSCLQETLTSGLKVTYTSPCGGTPTPTPTPTATATPRPSPTPRPRPTPAPRP